MAGVKGKSGGRRQGAGRKPKPPTRVPTRPDGKRDTLDLLIKIAFGEVDASPTQVQAAIAATRYVHAKPGDAGKKERKRAEAEKVAGRFAPIAPPRLAIVGGTRA